MKKVLSAIVLTVSMLVFASCNGKDSTEAYAGAAAEKAARGTDEALELSANQTREMVVSFDEEMSDYLMEQAADGVIGARTIAQTFAQTKAAGMACLSIAKMERVFPDAGEYEELHRKAGLHRFYRLSYDRPVEKENAARELLGMQCVETAEAPTPKKLCKAVLPFNDTYAAKYQWQYHNNGSIASGFVSGCDINVVPVWKEFTGGSPNVIVAIVDEGIDANHPDLGAVMLPPGANGSKNFVNYSYTIEAGDHGCHVAGIVGAINNNGKGVCGVAGGLDGNGGVRLMSCQIFGKKSGGDSANAIVWGADHGAVISQNSWGYDFDSNNDGKISGSELYIARNTTIDSSDKAAVDYFIKYAGCAPDGSQRADSPMKGGIVIFAAGNDNIDNGVPASYSPIIAVGAVGPDARKATYSNYGSWVDICAPGGEADRFPYLSGSYSYILSCQTTANSTPYTFMCGTSMACPMVSGVAALLVSYFGGPGFTCEQLKKMLLDNANPNIIPSTDNIGPLVDAYAAFKNNIHENSSPTISTSYTGGYTVRTGGALSIDYVAEDPDGDTCSFSLEGGDGSSSLESTGPGKCRLIINTEEKFTGSHSVMLKADDGNGGEASLKVEYTISANNAPELSTSYSGPWSVKVGSSLVMDFSAKDADGDLCSFSLKGDTSASLKPTGANSCRLTVSASAAFIGSHSATVTADDGHGGKDSKTVDYTITGLSSPVIATDYNGDYRVRVGQALEIIYTVTDEDSPNVDVSLQGDGSSILDNIGNGRYRFAVKALQPYCGTHSAVITADDRNSEPTRLTINYTVVPNSKPTITSSYSGSYTVRTGQSPIVIDYSVSDADGDKCTVTFTGDGSADFTELSEGQYRLTVNTDEIHAGTHRATIKADDGFGGTATKDVDYTVKLNHAPVIGAKGSFDPEIAVGQEVKASFSVADEDGDNITVSLQSDGSAKLNRPGTNDYYLSFNADKSREGSHTAKLTAADPYGKTAELNISYRIYVNQPPVITLDYDGPTTLPWNESGELVIKASDPEGKDGLALTVQSSNPVSKVSANGNIASVNVGNGKGSFTGTCTITATATDWLGETATATFRYTVLENRTPAALGTIDDAYLDMTGNGVELELSKYFSDPDKDDLEFSCAVDDNSRVRADIIGSKLVLNGLKSGIANVCVKAADKLGKSASINFKAGAFNLSGGPVIAPNPVRDSFTLRLGERTAVKLSIYTENGKFLKEINGNSSVFEPLVVNVRSLAPGRYIVKIEYDRQNWTRNMTKL